jgi:hypothetical protein
VLFEGCHILLGRMRSGMQRPSCEKSRGEESYREIIEVENPRLFLDVFSVVALSHLKSSPHSPSPQSMLSVLCSLNPRGDLTALSMCHINAPFPVYLPNVIFARQVPGSAREDSVGSVSRDLCIQKCMPVPGYPCNWKFVTQRTLWFNLMIMG